MADKILDLSQYASPVFLKGKNDTGILIIHGFTSTVSSMSYLGEKLNKKPYSNDDINVFKILSKQAALSIENCIFLEKFKNAQEKIFVAISANSFHHGLKTPAPHADLTGPPLSNSSTGSSLVRCHSIRWLRGLPRCPGL